MTSERDTQRSKVYAAESLVRRLFDRADQTGVRLIELHGSVIVLPVERRFASVESVQRYADLVLALSWVADRWPERATVPIAVRARAGQARAHYERLSASIAIPPHARNRAWAMREFVVLHEIAHHLAPDALEPGHGPQFVGRFTDLVDQLIGPEAGLLLRATMYDARVATTVGRPGRSITRQVDV